MPENASLKLFYCHLADEVKASLISDNSNLSSKEESVTSETSYFGNFMTSKEIEQV